ncbi:MAG: TIGR03086 family protein [Pseudonocardiaceae bacterium]|nr:TIGR03086 family protein [Pseudonocardiaceae bacterium]
MRTDGLLGQAIDYALGGVHGVRPELLSRSTPCRNWDLRMLLCHLNESLAALHEGIDAGYVGLEPGAEIAEPADDLAETFRYRAARLLGAWARTHDRARPIAVGEYPVGTGLVAGAGAIEIAVHGWDISEACGHHRPIPPGLAADLLDISPLLITESTRHALFAVPVEVSPLAGPADRLVAFLGRTPHAFGS